MGGLDAMPAKARFANTVDIFATAWGTQTGAASDRRAQRHAKGEDAQHGAKTAKPKHRRSGSGGQIPPESAALPVAAHEPPDRRRGSDSDLSKVAEPETEARSRSQTMPQSPTLPGMSVEGLMTSIERAVDSSLGSLVSHDPEGNLQGDEGGSPSDAQEADVCL